MMARINAMISSLLFVLSALVTLCFCSPNPSGLDWPANRALPQFPDAAEEIDYAKITALSGDEQILLVSLQGLVNRRKPRLYISWTQGGGTSDDTLNEAWLRQIEAQGYRSTDISSTPLRLIERYRSEIRGAIIYDMKLPDTVNLASTLAGYHSAVIATEELARRFNISIVEDLRGRFKDKFELYENAARTVWPNVTNRLITAIKPVMALLYANRTWDTLLRANSSVTDSSNNGTYKIDLSRFINRNGTVYVNISDAFPGDGYGPSVYNVRVTADRNQTIANFRPGTEAEDAFLFDDGGSHLADYPGGWRFADGPSAIIYRFEYPINITKLTLNLSMWNQFQVSATSSKPGYREVNAIFRDYIVSTAAPCVWLDSNVPREAALLDRVLRQFQPNTAYLGWFPNGDEMAGVTQLAKNGVYVAATDFYFNPTVFSGFRPKDPTQELPVGEPPWGPPPWGSPRWDPPPWGPPAKKFPKVVLCLVYLEGDNIQYNQRAMFGHWNDTTRGTVPIGWTISPLLRDIGPGILSYYQRTATENDLLIAGPDGTGYTYPGVWPKKALDAYLSQSGEYMRSTKTDKVLFVYDRINSTDNPLKPNLTLAFRDAVGKNRLRGILYGAFVSTAETIQVNLTEGFPVTNVVGIGNDESGAATLRNISDNWKGPGPLFVAGALSAFDMAPASVASMVKRLGSEFAVVRPDIWFELLRNREWHAGPGWPGPP